jgi:hypothetical protein
VENIFSTEHAACHTSLLQIVCTYWLVTYFVVDRVAGFPSTLARCNFFGEIHRHVA